MQFLEEKYTQVKIAPNIALIKYWGKLEPILNIPLNSSLSLTLNRNDIYTLTSVKLNKEIHQKDIVIFR